MDKYKVLLYPRAYRDIEDIYSYIVLEKMAPENAQGQTNRSWEVLMKVELFPESHQDWLVGRYAGKGYKQLMIDNHIAIYRNEKETKKVFVVTIQYQGRNF